MIFSIRCSVHGTRAGSCVDGSKMVPGAPTAPECHCLPVCTDITYSIPPKEVDGKVWREANPQWVMLVSHVSPKLTTWTLLGKLLVLGTPIAPPILLTVMVCSVWSRGSCL